MEESRQFIYTTGRINLQMKIRFLRILSIMVILLLITVSAPAPGISVLYISASKSVDPYERLIKAIVKVESSGDNLAYNETEEAFGAFQIRAIRVQDYNQRTGKEYKVEDCFSFDISKEIFLYYANITGFRDYEMIARNWNGSGKMTLEYWKKIKAYL